MEERSRRRSHLPSLPRRSTRPYRPGAERGARRRSPSHGRARRHAPPTGRVVAASAVSSGSRRRSAPGGAPTCPHYHVDRPDLAVPAPSEVCGAAHLAMAERADMLRRRAESSNSDPHLTRIAPLGPVDPYNYKSLYNLNVM